MITDTVKENRILLNKLIIMLQDNEQVDPIEPIESNETTEEVKEPEQSE